ncbi:MAG TPA: hypothetical protein VGE51_09770 [Fontimonas sp.]
MLPTLLVLASALIIGALASLHLWFTFVGPKLRPRDEDLEARMKRTPMRITRETTVWRAWIGFNASHSLGGLLFAAVYAYLALAAPALLFEHVFLPTLGAAFLGSFVALGRLYWFSVPYRGILLASACYLAAQLLARA